MLQADYLIQDMKKIF